MRISLISLAAASALALGGCAYDGYYGGLGVGYGGGYGGYYGDYGYGYGPYGGYGAYPGYYGGFGSPFGWYGDYYYPGTGVYVYDSYRRPRMWTNRERSYWTNRQTTTTGTTRTRVTSPNWSGFSHRSQQVQTTDRHHER